MIDINQMEQNILSFWDNVSAFEVSNKRIGKDFVFFDGPPFATGTPHYGHLLAGTIKDVICRYQNMLGKRVERRFGWDCHGLPIESLVQKKFGTSDTISVEDFNNKCQSVVLDYTNEWENVTSRMGRWIDFENCYRTMDLNFMESVWYVFKQIWEQNRIYKSYRVMPYSPKLMTPISNFEASSNYKEVEDPAVFVKFKITNNSFALVYTTTPWTLPANLALCVNPELEYSWIESENINYLISTKLITTFFKHFKIISSHKGIDLVGLSYTPLFNLRSQEGKSFQILADNFVTDNEGTGIVHLAPAYGEDDYRICKNNKIELLEILDQHCNYNNLFPDFLGKFCKEVDLDIIDILKKTGYLFSYKKIMHSYPYCERTNTPLIYRAVEGWYLRLEDLKDRLLNNNKQINWVPASIGENRFGNWLAEAKDWNISRNRLWGSCLPLWISEDGSDIICVGSIDELEKLSGIKANNLHKHVVDQIIIHINGKKYRRTPEVLDCWFESGCMPYAQNHYPFENKEYIENNFPADFIAEGLDQTRGWFYTLLVISTLLFDKPPFKNVIVNGLILANDGQKMSKSKNNYTNPMELISSIGADAIRGYLCSSAATHADPLLFNNKDAGSFNKDLIIPLLNAYNFFETYTSIDHWNPENLVTSDNILDRWINSKLNLLVKEINSDLETYQLNKFGPRIISFIKELNNWYIRSSRKRFWVGNNQEAYSTLYCVLNCLVKLLAPLMPFVAEHIFQKLNQNIKEKSVHWECFPTFKFIDYNLLSRMDVIIQLTNDLHKLRAEHNIRVRQPLAQFYISGIDLNLEEKDLLKEELNIKEILPMSFDELNFYDISFKANFKTLGKKFGKNTNEIAQWIAEQTRQPLIHPNFDLKTEDFFVVKCPKQGFVAVNSKNNLYSAILDINLTEELKQEGFIRDLISKLQSFRKDNGLNISDRIEIIFHSDILLHNLILKFQEQIEKSLLAKLFCQNLSQTQINFTYQEINFSITKIIN